MNSLELTLKYSKSTKGTHVYTDSEEDAPIPSLYIKRSAMQHEPPSEITITVKENS